MWSNGGQTKVSRNISARVTRELTTRTQNFFLSPLLYHQAITDYKYTSPYMLYHQSITDYKYT